MAINGENEDIADPKKKEKSNHQTMVQRKL